MFPACRFHKAVLLYYEYKKDIYEIPYTTMNVGTMHGGSAKNSVPAYCEISIDFRIANKKHIKKITKKHII